MVASKIYDSIKGNDKNDPRHYKKNIDKIKIPDEVTYPIAMSDLHLYEELNDIQINVFSFENYDDTIEDVRTCVVEEYKSNKHRKEVVNLLLVRGEGKSHYVLINNLSRLFSSKIKNNHTKFHCPHCLVKCYDTMEKLNTHIEKCLEIDEVDRVKIDVICECPEEGKNTLKFINSGRAFKHPFHVIADFESFFFFKTTLALIIRQPYINLRYTLINLDAQ